MNRVEQGNRLKQRRQIYSIVLVLEWTVYVSMPIWIYIYICETKCMAMEARPLLHGSNVQCGLFTLAASRWSLAKIVFCFFRFVSFHLLFALAVLSELTVCSALYVPWINRNNEKRQWLRIAWYFRFSYCFFSDKNWFLLFDICRVPILNEHSGMRNKGYQEKWKCLFRTCHSQMSILKLN